VGSIHDIWLVPAHDWDENSMRVKKQGCAEENMLIEGKGIADVGLLARKATIHPIRQLPVPCY
jgi:hypothetical protein